MNNNNVKMETGGYGVPELIFYQALPRMHALLL